jgi:hypothetical protein
MSTPAVMAGFASHRRHKINPERWVHVIVATSRSDVHHRRLKSRTSWKWRAGDRGSRSLRAKENPFVPPKSSFVRKTSSTANHVTVAADLKLDYQRLSEVTTEKTDSACYRS